MSIKIVQITIIKKQVVREAPTKPKSQMWETCRQELVKICVSGAALISIVALYAWITGTDIGVVDVFNAILTRGITLISR